MTINALVGDGAYASTANLPASPPTEAVIARAPVTLDDTVDVLIGAANLRVGPCRWSPVPTRSALLFPQVGAACLIVCSNQGHNHVVWWDATAGLGETPGVNALAGLLDAKGDLIAASAADTPARVPVGADGQLLVANPSAIQGVGWTTPHEGAVQAGVLASTDCALTIGSTSSVTIAAGVVYVASAGGVLLRTTPVSTILGGIPVAVNNRIDQVACDSTGLVTRLAGTTDVAGNTLAANPSTGGGRATIPAGSIRLHDLQVTSGGVLAANVHDRRPNALGLDYTITRTPGTDYTRSAATYDYIDVTNLRPRLECSGKRLRLRLIGSAYVNNAAEVPGYLDWWIDGASVDGGSTGRAFVANNSVYRFFVYEAIVAPAAGTHLIAPMFRGDGTNTFTIGAQTTVPLTMEIASIIPNNFNNGSV